MEFQPKNNSPEEVKEFQAIAKRLVSAQERGYLVNAHFHVSNLQETGGYILHAIVNGGLTFEGEQFLLSPNNKVSAVSKTEEQKDILQIKPGIFGVSLDVKELFKLWLQNGASRKK